MKTKTRNRIIYFLLIFCLTIIVFIILFTSVSKNSKNVLKQYKIDSSSFNTKPYLEYDKDFKLPNSIEFKGTLYSKTRAPLEEFVYKNTYIFMYRLPVISKMPLTRILQVKFGKIGPVTNDGGYELIDSFNDIKHSNYSILYRTGRPVSGTEIYFNLSGTNIKVLKRTDTLCSYYAQLGSFSIRYSSSDSFDFYGRQKESWKSKLLPVQINFREKNGHNYVFFNILKE